ncbi:Cytosolic Fe-S cluster assembly factor nar1 [Purpureocillium takamizusanense]|uniref:Cytosolic Fe-S cluster assembly factor NAR1 n=1 Tax=Purpureocillium takamizusanense TaxID=2060973 RepID=A0A9Q8V7E7_9HYPO|nr:Cytosolic Fe-S cluster assembly factor nar1 [Purpureocillium takamizusanense]UNI14779.1 Cytosolic Fe-S cluster assembly factor nar1 [Purpureocillium takamizusanense]
MSAILSADDLNDFISPGVACIKPIETLPPASDDAAATTSNETEVILDGQGAPASSSNGAAPAQISLTDCLACSGCVTSAEAVLVSLQSHAEVLSTLDAAPALRVVRGSSAGGGGFAVDGLDNDDAKLFVASVSPQTRANLAAACGGGVSAAQAGRMVEALLRGESGLASGGRWNNRFAWVLDTNVAREATLVLGADEVLGSSSFSSSSYPPSLSSSRASTPPSLSPRTPAQPILASSCPGWVCYAEKTHPHVLPHLSRVKSPQALTGTLVKTALSRALGIPPSRIWHLAVMPCFDKKLEASREELTDEAWAAGGAGGGRGVRDVDCVITSKEVLMLAESRGMDFFSPLKGGGASSLSAPDPFPDAMLHEFLFPRGGSRTPPRAAGTSGGLLHHILQSRAAQTPGAEIQVNRGRNADVVEFLVTVGGEPVFKAARYYGFRNIQNLVRKLKPARPSRMPGGRPFGSARRPTAAKSASASLEYSYVEVMACPGGCTNGGGQIKVDDPVVLERRNLAGNPGPQEQKEWLAEVDEAYFSADEAGRFDGGGGGGGGGGGDGAEGGGDVVGGISRSYIHDTLAYWSRMTGIGLDGLAYTSYREVISDVGKDKAGSAETVVQLAGKIGGGW